MIVNPVAENVCGTIGTILWTCQIIPQIWKSWKDKSTEGLSPWLMLLWAISGIFLGVYVIVQNISIPIIIQPQLFTVLAIVSWMQCLYYGRGQSAKSCLMVGAAFLLAFGALESSLSFAVKIADQRGNDRPLQFFGIFSAVIVSLALIPQYVEIWQRREVVGISVLFMAIDIGGAVFCMLSLLFKPQFDAVAAVTYIAVMVQDGVIIAAAAILNPLAKRRRARNAHLTTPTTAQTYELPQVSSPATSDTKALGDAAVDLPTLGELDPWSEDLEAATPTMTEPNSPKGTESLKIVDSK